MKVVVAVLMGLISGFLLYLMASMLTADFGNTARSPSGAFIFLTFLGGGAVSAWLLLRGARSTSAVFRRGFLLGAAEWLTMAFVGVVFSGRAVSQTVAQGAGDGASAGAAIGGGIAAAITGGVSIFMAVVCLIGFTIAYFIGREMRDTTTTPTRKCPECAEMIQPDARKCKHCGASLTPEYTVAERSPR